VRIVKKLVIVVVAVVAVGALAVAAMLGPVSYRRAAAVREYRAQGFQIVEGCNGGAAVQADTQVYTIKQYLEESTDWPTNIVVQLQGALVTAQEKARVLIDDCRRRGHCDNIDPNAPRHGPPTFSPVQVNLGNSSAGYITVKLAANRVRGATASGFVGSDIGAEGMSRQSNGQMGRD